MGKKMVLIDGNNLLFRMFFGIPNKIYDTSGNMVQGTIGFIGSILKYIKEYSPDSLMVVFDSEIPSDKYIGDSSYKKNRVMDYGELSDEQNPFTQLPDIKKCLDYMGIVNLEIPQCEADDVIATICKKYYSLYDQIFIISTDKDYFQLINDKIFVICPRGKNTVVYTKDLLFEKFGVYPKDYIFFSSLIGDKSDNILGIKGIGKITAASLVNKYNDIDDLFNHINALQPGIAKKLGGEKIHLQRNIYLISMNSDLNLNISIDACDIQKFNFTKVRTMDIIERVRKNEEMSI